MNALNSIALSGLRTSMLRMDASAHNIANVQTQGFRRQVVSSSAQPEGGVTARLDHAAEPGEALAQDWVDQISAGAAFKASLFSLQTGRNTLGSLLDVLA